MEDLFLGPSYLLVEVEHCQEVLVVVDALQPLEEASSFLDTVGMVLEVASDLDPFH